MKCENCGHENDPKYVKLQQMVSFSKRSIAGDYPVYRIQLMQKFRIRNTDWRDYYGPRLKEEGIFVTDE